MLPNRVTATPSPTTAVKPENALLPTPGTFPAPLTPPAAALMPALSGASAQACAPQPAGDSPVAKVKLEEEQAVGDEQGTVVDTEAAAAAAGTAAVGTEAAGTAGVAAAAAAAPNGGGDSLQVSAAVVIGHQCEGGSEGPAGRGRQGNAASAGDSIHRDGMEGSTEKLPEGEGGAGYQPVVINPGRLAKGANGGTFAEIEVRGGRRGEVGGPGSDVADRISVHIRKL